MKLYCTKYATTEGILEFDGKVEEVNGHTYGASTGHGSCKLWLKSGEYFSTLDEAQKDALDRLAKNIEKAEKAVEKAQKKLAKAYADQGVKVRQWTPQKGTIK